MLQFSQITLQRGGKVLFDQANLTIFAGQKVGLVGANGCGKSSLFAILRGELSIDAGDYDIPKQLVIASVAQETPALEKSAIQYVIDGDRQLRLIEQQLAIAEEKGDAHGIAHAHEVLAAIDGYSAYARAAQLLRGLSFSAADIEKPVKDFSGGWRMRLNLAQALMCRSDVLLLDEPTNHLDLDAIIWLEKWLQRYAGTLLVISHDRDFLDNIVTRIVHVEHQKLHSYTSDYSGFEIMRAEKLALQQSAHEKQQKKMAHMQAFVDRFRAKASKARQAQSRLKALSKMALIAAAHADSAFQFNFEEPKSIPNPLITLSNVELGYGEHAVLKNVNLTISAHERIGLLGPNGAGKTTLIKSFARLLSAQSGVIQPSDKLVVGYFAQHQVDYLQLNHSPLQHLRSLAPDAPEKNLRTFLGKFNFSGDMALTAIENFSGGEKARLALALIIWQRPNLLLLDEPTNHLDLEMRYALNQALQEYTGTLVLVSHDRHLLRSTCDDLLLVAEQRVQHFKGDLHDYQLWLQEFRRTQHQEASTPKIKNVVQKSAEVLKLQQPWLKKAKAYEQQLAKIEQSLQKLEEKLSDESLYAASQHAQLQNYLKQKTVLQKEQQTVEMEWLEAQEAIERLAKQDIEHE